MRHRKKPGHTRSFKARLTIITLSVLLFVALIAIWSLGIEPGLLTVTKRIIVDSQLPPEWQGRTIAFFSDIHAGPTFDLDRVTKVVEAISRANPDLVLFGGDMVDSRTPTDPSYAAQLGQILARLKPPFGSYAVLGNHDNRLNAERKMCRSILEAGGFKLLVNKSVMIDGLWLGGLDESYFGNPDLAATFASKNIISGSPAAAGGTSLTSSGNAWKVLLMHQPDFAAALPEPAARLILSGHSHDGQVTFLGRPIITVYQGRLYPYGFYQLSSERQMFVSRGTGTIGLPARLFAPPEIVLLTLKSS
jgi:uncharacterized protein